MHSKKLLGEQLVEKGLISRDKLWEALRVQSKTGEKLGRVLVNMGLVTEEHIEEAMGSRRESLKNIDPEIIRIIPEQLVKRHNVIPLRKEGNKLRDWKLNPFQPKKGKLSLLLINISV